jgi:hypothetical protein
MGRGDVLIENNGKASTAGRVAPSQYKEIINLKAYS